MAHEVAHLGGGTTLSGCGSNYEEGRGTEGVIFKVIRDRRGVLRGKYKILFSVVLNGGSGGLWVKEGKGRKDRVVSPKKKKK